MRSATMMVLALAFGCGDDSSSDAGRDSASSDSGRDSASSDSATSDAQADASDAGRCEPETCELACDFGFARGPDGCEFCECKPEPDESCAIDADCVVARSVTGCCGCEDGHSQAQVAREVCLVERGDTPVAGCLPDPELCATIDCAACPPVLRAVCTEGVCTGSDECGEDEVPFQTQCVPACNAHSDCAVAADYSGCCGACVPVHSDFVDDEACWAERQSDTACAPPAGSCDDLGCPPPPSDCPGAFLSAVCMQDGECASGGTAGECPAGFTDVDDVCVPD